MTTFTPTFYQQIATSLVGGDTLGSAKHLIARVTHVVQGPFELGTNVPDKYYNDPTDLGKITFQVLGTPQDRTLESAGNSTAMPVNSALRQYPLEGEFVLIHPGPGRDLNESLGQYEYYYSLPYNLWNQSHHNAFPDLGDYSLYVNKIRRTYVDSLNTNQAINTSVTGGLNMPLGPNFPEKHTVRPLRQFTGDVTIEGRWGNSIRFGSSNPVPADQNPWSKTTINLASRKLIPEPGNPITIIRNGQGKQENAITWFHTVEDINRDPTSIYLTQGQEITIDDINNNFSLASLDVTLENTYTVSIPLQQQLTSTENVSAAEQDNATLNNNV